MNFNLSRHRLLDKSSVSDIARRDDHYHPLRLKIGLGKHTHPDLALLQGPQERVDTGGSIRGKWGEQAKHLRIIDLAGYEKRKTPIIRKKKIDRL